MTAGIYHQATPLHMIVTTTVGGQTVRRSYIHITRNQPWSFTADAAEAVASALIDLIVKINGDGTTTEDPAGLTAEVDSVGTPTANSVGFTVEATLANRGDWYQIGIQITGTSGQVWTELLDLKVVA
jgi:hypothetical protein